MLLEVTNNLEAIAQTVRQYCEKKVRPFVRQWDETQEFPAHVFHELGELGLMGVLVPESYGGSGLNYQEYVTAIAELSRVDPAIGLSMAAHNSLCTNHICCSATRRRSKPTCPGWLPASGSGPGA
jgi:alkylation response protein AidB-like acyl-CoA dehydrogenase